MLFALSRILNAVAAIASGRGLYDIAEYAKLAGSFLKETDDAKAELEVLADEMEKMVTEGRDPTPEEVQAVKDRRKALSDEIASVDLSGEEEPT